jgi:hypothetical protein
LCCLSLPLAPLLSDLVACGAATSRQSGEISIEDWTTVLQLCQPKRSLTEVELLFHLADRESRGSLRLPEFLNMCDFMDLRVKPNNPRSAERILCGVNISLMSRVIRSK